MKKETAARLIPMIQVLLFILCMVTGSKALLIFFAVFTGVCVAARYALIGRESRPRR